MLEYAASCGRAIDRNLIVVVLYNEACAYQGQWVLDKCSQYLDGVIYNLEVSIHEEDGSNECKALVAKRSSFLAKSYLQYCAILSQLGRHQGALENSKKAARMLNKFFQKAFEFCCGFRKNAESSANSSQTSSKPSRTFSQKLSNQKDSESTNDSEQRQLFLMKDEITFAKLVVEQSFDLLQDMANISPNEDLSLYSEQFKAAKKQLNIWRHHVENNEKQLRKGFRVAAGHKQEDSRYQFFLTFDFPPYRSLLGLQNIQEWIEQFNIGSIMHMVPLSYQEFSSPGEILYEISKKVLLERIIYLSISYFTIATEIRFVEVEKAKCNGIKEKDIATKDFKMSELFHLKAIELACKYVTCQSPYIQHLITSYSKHYTQNLESKESGEFDCQKQSQREKKQMRSLPTSNQCKSDPESEDSSIKKSNSKEKPSIQLISSPTSRLLHSFINQSSSEKTSRIKINEPNLKNDILEQLFRNKKRSNVMKSWGMNLYYQHSPVNSIPFISALQTKRESSPNLQGQTANSVTALSFLYNAMIYNESQKVSGLTDKKNYSSNDIQQKVLVNNLIKKDNSLAMSKDSMPKQKNADSAGVQSKNGKFMLCNLLKMRPSLPTQRNSSNFQNVQVPEWCRTERSKDYNDLVSPQNSKSPRQKWKKQIQSKKSQSGLKFATSEMAPSSSSHVTQSRAVKVIQKQLPISIDTIHQLLRNNRSDEDRKISD